jgi:serine/threonine-protein kinase
VIKRPLEHLRADARANESLRREARLGAQLRHPNIVQVLDAGAHDGYDYIVLEYVHGASLRTLMDADESSRVREPPLEVALAIARDIARALHRAHELTDEHGASLGLVHRDVAPGNVLLGLDGAVKLADFGIAKETHVVTLSGSMHGTVTYMAPEQCRGHAFDRRADIFSLGVILYELVTGTRLFWADNDVASLHRVLSGTVTRPRRIEPSIPVALEDLVMKALASDPEDRFSTARALANELELFGASSGMVLDARHIAAWVHDLLGPRDQPWIDAATVVDVEPMCDGGLAELIVATGGDEPPEPTFGPAFDDAEAETVPSRPHHKHRSRAVIAGVVGGALAIGGVAAYVMTRSPGPRPAPAVLVTPAATPPAQQTGAPAPPPVSPPSAPAPALVAAPESAPAPVPTRRPKPHHPARPPAVPAHTSSPPRDAGATKPAKVEWDPTLLLPTDPHK